MSRGIRFYHGGAPGLRRGDVITPHPTRHMDGCPICAARADESHAPDRVFVTPERIYAKYYASKWGHGALYEVEPVGVVLRSAPDSIESYGVRAARVVKVIGRGIQLTPSERRHLYRVWAVADAAAGREGDPAVEAELRRMLGIAPKERVL